MSNYKERGRMELAQLYFPQLGGIAAWKKLQHWISICQPLKDELRQLGYTGRQRTFTPKQVSRIVHYLGEYYPPPFLPEGRREPLLNSEGDFCAAEMTVDS